MDRRAKIAGEVLVVAAIFIIMALEVVSLVLENAMSLSRYAVIWRPTVSSAQLFIASFLFVWKARRFSKTCIFTKIASWTMLLVFGLSIPYPILKNVYNLDIGLFAAFETTLIMGTILMVAAAIFRFIKNY